MIIAERFCELCMPEAFCEFETVRKRFCSICEFCERKKSPSWEIKLSKDFHVSHLEERVRSISHRITQMNRIHRVSQRPCGQPISQSVTPIMGSNALCSLYAGGLLWTRTCAQKSSVRSVSSVRKKLPSVSHRPYLIEWVRSLSHRRTQKNRTHKASQRH